MGYADRDYMKPGRGPTRFPRGYDKPPGMFDGVPVTKWLLIVSVVIFFLNVLLTTSPEQVPPLVEWGYFSVEKAFQNFQIWRLLTFQFLHFEMGSMLLAMLGIFFFGPHVERWMGSRSFAFFFFLCGIAGALALSALSLTGAIGMEQGLLGPRAATFGILTIFFFIAPDAVVHLFLVIPIKMRTLGILFFAFGIIHILSNGLGGSIGHIGGALFGVLIMKNAGARRWLDSLASIKTNKPSSPKKKSRDAEIIREKKRSSPLEVTEEVNRILDKISANGIQSLTPKERETLDRSRKNK